MLRTAHARDASGHIHSHSDEEFARSVAQAVASDEKVASIILSFSFSFPHHLPCHQHTGSRDAC
jgi:hypothetical protein